ncbi:MAG: hypothetical protein M0Q14_06315 [Tissierellaceae bacterium]|nr:hypothetical protein [Tissierellaceae bacterium]
MESLSYDEVRKIEMSATKKLLKYISEGAHDENILNSLEFYYPDFGGDKHRIAFNIWFSLDFADKEGKTFIQKFLEEGNVKLSSKEKKVLKDQSKSTVSLFEVVFIEDEKIKVLDLLLHETYELWEPELTGALAIGDFIFARIGRILGNPTFIGDVSYLPPSMRDVFVEDVLYDFNRERQNNPKLTMKKYLKVNSINLYRIYTDIIYDAMEIDDDIISTIYDELDEFDNFLQLKGNRLSAKRHLTNLMEFFEYYLADEDLTLYDMDRIDFHLFFRESIKEGFLISPEDINSYISTFKAYLGFLSNKNSEYKEKYMEILDVSKKRFKYMRKFNEVQSPFTIDRRISEIVSDDSSDEAFSLIMDFDKFLLYVLDSPLVLTNKTRLIRKKNLLEINEFLTLSQIVDKKVPIQKDYVVIHLFYKFSLYLGLTSMEEGLLAITKKGNNFLRLKDEDKFSLFFQYIWSPDFFKEILSPKKAAISAKLKGSLIDMLHGLKTNHKYNIIDLLEKLSLHPLFFFDYYEYLQILGMIKYVLYPNYELIITPLGKSLISFLKVVDEEREPGTIVELVDYRKSSYDAVARKP